MDDSLTDSDQMIVVGDDSLLKVAVSNLIDNACKYSSDHAVDIKFRHIEKFIEVIFDRQRYWNFREGSAKDL